MYVEEDENSSLNHPVEKVEIRLIRSSVYRLIAGKYTYDVFSLAWWSETSRLIKRS